MMSSVAVSPAAQRSVASADVILRGLTVASCAGLLGAELVAAPGGAGGVLRVAALAVGTLISVLGAALAPDPIALLRLIGRADPPARAG